MSIVLFTCKASDNKYLLTKALAKPEIVIVC